MKYLLTLYSQHRRQHQATPKTVENQQRYYHLSLGRLQLDIWLSQFCDAQIVL